MLTLSQSIAKAKQTHGIAFLPFIAAGYPDLATSLKLLPALERAGAAAVEIGFPFSDPIADGPTIQAAFTEALAKKLKIDQIFAGLTAIRKEIALPVVAMVSYSVVFRYGVDRFIERAKSSGFNGLLIPDLPPPEAQTVCEKIRAGGLDTVLLVSPSTPPARRELIAKLCSGFVYYLSLAGTTGEREQLPADLEANVRELKTHTQIPVCVGFGIHKREHLQQLAKVADGAIVGSAVVKRLKGAADPVAAVEAYARELVGA
ncbi:MAG: tryptophan synthase subunit alpha [Tepidisphaeraceae bacterium]